MDKVYKDINGIGVHSGALVATGVEDGGADVAREGIWLGGWWWWGMVLGGDQLGVEFVDNVDVKVMDGGNREVEVVARATAVRNWSKSAAR